MKIKLILNGSFPVYPVFQASLVYPNFQVNRDCRRVRKHLLPLRQRLSPNSNRLQYLRKEKHH
jgi:hypothetical protein